MILDRKYFVGLSKVLSLFLPVLILGCSEKKNTAKMDFARPVQSGTVITQSVPNFIESFGYLNSINNVDIKSQVTGKIEKCYFKEGQEVKKGDLLFSIDPRIYQAKVDELSAQLKSDLADVKTKQYIVDKDKRLAETKAMAEQDYINYLTQLEMAQATVELDKATIEQNKINLDYCKITSPIDGVTGKREVDPGNIVTANSGSTLVNIKSIDPLYADFTIPEKNLFRLRGSMKKNKLQVVVQIEEFEVKENKTGALYTGTLEFINNEVSNKTGTIFLRAIIPNPKEELWPGQFVRVYLILNIDKNALLVPYVSVQQGLKGYYLFTIERNKAILHYVNPGLKHNDYIAITTVKKNAIKPGNKVVTVGQMGLTPNVNVKIIKEAKFQCPPTPKYYLDRVVNKNQNKKMQIPTTKHNIPTNPSKESNN